MSETISPLLRWLKYVDDQLSSEAVEYIKLGLYSELARYYSEIQKIEKPSLIYHCLVERCLSGNKIKGLKIFIHVLRGLGEGLRGNRVVDEGFGEESFYRITNPGLLNVKKMSVNFKFFQCLLKITIKARKTSLGDRLTVRFSKERFLNMNHRHIQDLPDLMIRLYQGHFIKANNNHHLVEALYKYKASTCLRYLNDYHKSIGLQPIALAQDQLGETSSSDPSASSEESSDCQFPFARTSDGELIYYSDENNISKFDYFTTMTELLLPSGDYMDGEVNDEDEDVGDSQDTDMMLRREHAARGQLMISSERRSQSKLRSGCICTAAIFSVLLVALVLLVSIFFGTIWIHLIKVPNDSEALILQDSIIIVEEFNNFYHKTISISLDDKHQLKNTTNLDSLRIDFYGLEGSCAGIETEAVYKNPRSFVLTKQNISNFVPKFAIRGSTFSYEVSGKGDAVLQRNALVEVCISTQSSSECFRKSLLGDTGYYVVPRSDYYSFEVQSLETIEQLWLNVTEKLKSLHVNTKELLGCSINVSNSICHITLPFKVNKLCFIAEFYKVSNDDIHAVDLEVQVEEYRLHEILEITLPIIVFVLFITCVCGIFLKCYCGYHSNRQVQEIAI